MSFPERITFEECISKTKFTKANNTGKYQYNTMLFLKKSESNTARKLLEEQNLSYYTIEDSQVVVFFICQKEFINHPTRLTNKVGDFDISDAVQYKHI